MEVRLATENDKKGLYALWHEVFSDPEEIIDDYYNTVIKAENTVMAETDGKIVSALYLIETEIVHKGKAYKAYYVYAAATDENYRRQGIMKNLLDYSTSLAKSRNIDYLFLHPERNREDLYNYYSKAGFKTAFYQKSESFDEKIFDADYSYVRWGKDVVELDGRQNDDSSFTSKHGYVSYYCEMGMVYADYFVSETPYELMTDLHSFLGLKIAGANVPANEHDEFARKTGMIKKISDTAPEIRSAYMGLTLE